MLGLFFGVTGTATCPEKKKADEQTREQSVSISDTIIHNELRP
jgi:hypothetical protein